MLVKPAMAAEPEQDIGINTLQIQKSPDELRWGRFHQGILVSLFPFIPYILFLFQNSLLSDFSVEFAWFTIAFQYPGAGDRFAGTVVEIDLLEALA